MIKINGKYSLAKDKLNWILMKKTHSKGDEVVNIKAGTTSICEEDVFVNDGFFGRLDHLANKIAKDLDVSQVETMQELIESYDALASQLTSLIKQKEEEHSAK